MPVKLITLVVGARPNFMKIAPLIRSLYNAKDTFNFRLVHTCQHMDQNMDRVFFLDLGIPKPDCFLKAKGKTHAEQTGSIMVEFEKECFKYRPDLVVVVGDVNSTVACAIATKKLGIKLAHIEAGLRSNDREMPEEINRVIIDAISDLLFITEQSGMDNLLKEGKGRENLFYVGNIMIDNLYYQLKKLEIVSKNNFSYSFLKQKLEKYAVLTLHRPSNVDIKETFNGIIKAINNIAKEIPIIFSVHPRTKIRIQEFNLKFHKNVHLLEPMSHLEFLNLWKDSKLVFTDSGGLQEETTALGIRCVTIRKNTERPITIEKGTNILSGTKSQDIERAYLNSIKLGQAKTSSIHLWDGLTSIRILKILMENIK